MSPEQDTAIAESIIANNNDSAENNRRSAKANTEKGKVYRALQSAIWQRTAAERRLADGLLDELKAESKRRDAESAARVRLIDAYSQGERFRRPWWQMGLGLLFGVMAATLIFACVQQARGGEALYFFGNPSMGAISTPTGIFSTPEPTPVGLSKWNLPTSTMSYAQFVTLAKQFPSNNCPTTYAQATWDIDLPSNPSHGVNSQFSWDGTQASLEFEAGDNIGHTIRQAKDGLAAFEVSAGQWKVIGALDSQRVNNRQTARLVCFASNPVK